MRSLICTATAALCFAGGVAHADTINTFNLQSDLTDGYTAQGTVTVDTTSGEVTGSHFTLSQSGTVEATFTSADLAEGFGQDYLVEFAGSNPGYEYELLLPTASLVGYKGGSVCTEAATCGGYPSGVFLPSGDAEAISGSLSASASATPEPASLLLLATGFAVGMFAIRRRRSTE